MKPVLRNKDKGTALERYYKSFMHAVDGIVYALKFEHNMIIILLAAILAILAGFIFNISEVEWFFVIIIIGLIAATEMINTAIEATIDLITTKTHPLRKRLKYTASSTSLILSLTAFIGALIIFVPKLIEIIK